MIRRILPLILVSGCTGGPEFFFSHMSTMESETRGVVLYEDGQRGHAAMWNTTCEFDTLNGWLIDDHDLPTESEVIQDQHQGTALAVSDEGVHTIYERTDTPLSQVVAARLQDDGSLITIRWDEADDGCVVDVWDSTASVPDALCAEGVSVDTDRQGGLVVATGKDLYSVDEGGAVWLASDVDLVVHDGSNGMTYVAQLFGDRVSGLDAGGKAVWTAQTDGPITSLDDMGQRGMAVVMVEDLTTGRGALQMFEGTSGEEVVRHDTPSGDGEITVSVDGTTLAVTIPGQVHFYDVLAVGETPKRRRTFGTRDGFLNLNNDDRVFSD